MHNATIDRPTLTRAQRRELEAELRRELARLERLLGPHTTPATPDARTAPLDARVANDASDDAGVATALRSRASLRHAAVLGALARIADGSYGVCASCQRPIPYGRLIVMPEAAHCVACGARL